MPGGRPVCLLAASREGCTGAWTHGWWHVLRCARAQRLRRVQLPTLSSRRLSCWCRIRVLGWVRWLEVRLPCARRVGVPDAAPSCPDACHCHWPLHRVTRWGNVGPPAHTASAIRPLAGVRSDSAAVPIRDTCAILHVWHGVGGEGDCVRYADVSCACQMASCLWRLIWSQCTGGTHVAGSARSGPVLGAGSVDIAGQTPQWKGGCLECDAGCRVLLPRR